MPNAPCREVSRLRVSRLPCGLVLGYPCDAASAAAYGRLPEWPKGAVCKTVGSAYVGSNPTPATHFRRSRPVTRSCVTGFWRERERLCRPSVVSRGLCAGQVRSSQAVACRAGGSHLSCGKSLLTGWCRPRSGSGRGRSPWARGGRLTEVHGYIADTVCGEPTVLATARLHALRRTGVAGSRVDGVFDPLADVVFLTVGTVQAHLEQDAPGTL